MKKVFIIFVSCYLAINSFGQVSIGNPSAPDSNVILDLSNGNNKGLLLTNTTNPPTEPVGNIVFNSTYNMLSLVDTSGKVNLLSPWNYDPNNDLIIFLKDGLNLGLGTSNPNAKLHIIGATTASKLGGGGFFKLGGNNQHIVMDNTKIISKSNGVTESDLQLQEEGHLKVGNHFTTDITNGASINGPVPSGAIFMWSTAKSGAIPNGWKICDGTDNTPDLRDKFIMGAGGNYAVDSTGGSADAVVVDHTHTATVTDPGHVHSYTKENPRGGGPNGSEDGESDFFPHNTNSSTTGITVSNGSTGVSGTNMNIPPYYALVFIMKK